jgi:hypothetical protein
MVHGDVCLALSNLLGGKLGTAQSHTASHGSTCRRRICAMRRHKLRDAKAARRTLALASPQRSPHRSFNRIGGLP